MNLTKMNLHRHQLLQLITMFVTATEFLHGCRTTTPLPSPPPPPPIQLARDQNSGQVRDNNRMIRDNGLRCAYSPTQNDDNVYWYFECRPSFLQNSGTLQVKIQLFQGIFSPWNLLLNESVRVRLTDVTRNIEVLNAPNNLTVKDFAIGKDFTTSNIIPSNALYKIEVSITRGGGVTQTASTHILINNIFGAQKNLNLQHFRQQYGNPSVFEDAIDYSNQGGYNYLSKLQDCNINIQRGVDGVVTVPNSPTGDWKEENLQATARELYLLSNDDFNLVSATRLVNDNNFPLNFAGKTIPHFKCSFVFVGYMKWVGGNVPTNRPVWVGRTICHELAHAILVNASENREEVNRTTTTFGAPQLTDHVSHAPRSSSDNKCILLNSFLVMNGNPVALDASEKFCLYHRYLMYFIF